MFTDLTDEPAGTGVPWLNKCIGWIASRRAQVVLAAIVLQFVVLGTMVVKSALPLITGKTILVRVAPFDPRDLFRGDYVILSYDFSRVPDSVSPLRADEFGETAIFVTLVPDADGKHWKAGTFSAERPASGLYLQGKLGGGGAQYGIESFFVQEGKGHLYEDAVRNHKLSAEIVVDGTGQAALERLVIE